MLVTPRSRQSRLNLSPDAIQRTGVSPLAHQVAALIHAEITAGRLVSGDPLPAMRALAKNLNVSKGVVEAAYNALESSGVVVARRQGVVVRSKAPARVLRSSRFIEEWTRITRGAIHRDTTAFCVDYGITWEQYDIHLSTSEPEADDRAAGLLGVRVGTPLLRRDFTELARGVPVQLRTSYMVLTCVAGTRITEASRQPWPGGLLAELYHLRLSLLSVRESVVHRSALGQEVEKLWLPSGAYVQEVTRQFRCLDQRKRQIIGEASVVILPAGDNRLEWETHV